jgi:hypothetical protein
MRSLNKLIFSAWIILFLFLFIPFTNAVGPFSLDWSYAASYQISQHALDSVGQVVYFGESDTFYKDFLYAVNITNGQKVWQYNTSLPVNYISHFKKDNIDRLVVGTGGSETQPSKSYVLALSQNNVTLWKSTNLVSSVTSLSSTEINVTGTEDVVAGLENGTVVHLSGTDGTIQWRNNCTGTVYNIVQLNNGSVAVGTFERLTGAGHIYCFKKNGSLRWSYTLGPGIALNLIKRFGNSAGAGVPEVVAVFTDHLIHVLNGTTGQDIKPKDGSAFFSVGRNVKDLLCTQDYTKDGFPDILAGIENGSLIIVNGRDATLFRGPVRISSFTLSYIQYMNFYENGIAYSNKTLVVSLQENPNAYFIAGINASTLSVMKEYSISATAINLFNIGNFTRNFTGDLIYSIGSTVYSLSGTEIIVSEFPSQIILAILIAVAWFLVTIPREERSRID